MGLIGFIGFVGDRSESVGGTSGGGWSASTVAWAAKRTSRRGRLGAAFGGTVAGVKPREARAAGCAESSKDWFGICLIVLRGRGATDESCGGSAHGAIE